MNSSRKNTAFILATLVAALFVTPSAPRAQSDPVPFWRKPQVTPTTPPPAPPGAPQAATPRSGTSPRAAAGDAPVIARIEGRPVTQRDFDAIAIPYMARLRGDFGGNIDKDVQKIANHNVLDELIRRELVVIEARRKGVEATQAEVDALLAQDPFFQTNGKFDNTKFSAFKTSPTSNYVQVLPRVREMAAVTRYEDQLRQSFTPAPALVRAEWAKRSDTARFEFLPVLVRDMSFEGEASEDECRAYYEAHPDQFQKRARIRMRTWRQALPAEGDSTRDEARKSSMARAGAAMDSLKTLALADSGGRFVDGVFFDLPATSVPGLGRAPDLLTSVNRLETETAQNHLGPLELPDAVVIATVIERQPKRLPPLQEVLGDVKRRADADKRRTLADADRRAYFDANHPRWKGPRVSLTRVVLSAEAVAVKAPAPAEVDRWYAQHGRRLYGMPDSSKAWIPPANDSLRLVVRSRMVDEQRPVKLAESLDRIAAALRTSRDPRGVARSNGAAAETLTFVRDAVPDTLFSKTLIDSLLAAEPARRGEIQGPRVFGGKGAVWRIDAVDTAFVPAYEAVRARSDQEFNEDRRRKDEAEGRAHFESHRTEYKTPPRFVLEYVAVPVPSADSVRLTDADLKRHYDANVASYRQEEQVRAAHILLSTRGEGGADLDARARATADSLLKAAQGGADFTDLAKRFSQEPGAANSGGDLGWFGRNRMVPEFEQAAFALAPGQLSKVVKTQFGYHVIRVIERKAAGQRGFDEVREELRAQLVQTQGDSLARRRATALRRRLVAATTPAALAAAAAAYGGLRETQPMAASEPVPDLGYVPGMQQILPSLETRRWAPDVYKAAGSYLVFRIREKVAPKQAEFDEVKNLATEDMKSAKRRVVHAQKVAAIRAALASGARLDSLAAPYGGLKDSGPLSQGSGFVAGIGQEPRAVARAFAMQPGAVSDTLQVATGVLWLRLAEKKSGTAEEFQQARGAIVDEMVRKKMEAWLESKKKTVTIEILRSDLKGPKPSPVRTVTMSSGG